MSKQLKRLERSFRQTLESYAQIDEIPLVFKTECNEFSQSHIYMSEADVMMPLKRIRAKASIDLIKEIAGEMHIDSRDLYVIEIAVYPTYRSADITLITETTQTNAEKLRMQRAVLCGLEAALSFTENKKFEHVTVTPYGRPDKQIVDMHSMRLGIAPVNAGRAYAPFEW